MQTRKNDLIYPGLTKLEYFSIQCLKGILSNPELNRDDSYSPKDNAILAIEAAKLLIYEINKEECNESNQADD